VGWTHPPPQPSLRPDCCVHRSPHPLSAGGAAWQAAAAPSAAPGGSAVPSHDRGLLARLDALVDLAADRHGLALLPGGRLAAAEAPGRGPGHRARRPQGVGRAAAGRDPARRGRAAAGRRRGGRAAAGARRPARGDQPPQCLGPDRRIPPCRPHIRRLVPLGSLAGSSYMHARAGALVVGRRWILRHCHGVHSREVLRAVQGYHVVLGPQRCWTAPGQRGYLSVTMSMLVSRLDRASESYRANRSANLRLLEELSEQLAQSRPGGGQKYGDRHRCSALRCRLATRGGEGYGRLRRVPDVITKVLVADRGELIRQVRTTGRLLGCSERSNSSTAHGDGLDCEQFGFESFPSGDGRPGSRASHLSADNVWPLSCSEKWIDPGGACVRE
jgi:hypothetical protein